MTGMYEVVWGDAGQQRETTACKGRRALEIMAWEPVSAGEAETEDQGMEGDMAQSTEQDTGGDVRPLWQDAGIATEKRGVPARRSEK